MRPGWEIKTIGEVCEIRSGRNQKDVENPAGKYPIYGSGGIMGYADDYLCEAGATIIGRKGSINNPIFVETKFWNVDTAFGFSPKETILPKFLFYFCKGFDFQAMNKGTTIPSLVKTDLLQIRIPVPSTTEQQRIVDILDQEFAKIDALKANAEKSLQAAKDLFFQILAETFSNPDWSRKRIGDVFDTGAGGTPLKTYKEYYENGNIPWLRSGEVCKKYITDTELFITQLGMDNSSAKMFPEKSVVVAMYGATAGQVGILHLETTTNQAVCGIFPRKDYIPEFVYYSLLNSKKGLVAQATGNAQPNISQIKIKNTLIPVIPKEQQDAVVARLDNLNGRCNALQENHQKTLALCDDLKQSLLRKAFNGEL